MSKSKPRRNTLNLAAEDLPTSAPSELSHAKADLPTWAMVCLSMYAVIHTLAVYAEPLRFSTQAESPAPADDAILLRNSLKPYIDMMYLNHGYYFFAPNPGPSHLVVCVFNEVNFGKGSTTGNTTLNPPETERLVYPDKDKQRPRLLYHRYFMFTEFYHTLFTPQDLPEKSEDGTPLPPELQWSKTLYAQLTQSLEKYFQSRHPARRFQIFRVEHALPSSRQVLGEKMKLNDPRLYTELPESFVPLDPRFAPAVPFGMPLPAAPFVAPQPSETERSSVPAEVQLGAPVEGAKPQ